MEQKYNFHGVDIVKDDIILYKNEPFYFDSVYSEDVFILYDKDNQKIVVNGKTHLKPIQQNFNGFIHPSVGTKGKLKIKPKKDIYKINLDTMHVDRISDLNIVYAGIHNTVPPFIMVNPINKEGLIINIPWQLIEWESKPKQEPQVTYCSTMKLVLPINEIIREGIKIKHVFDRYFCSSQQFLKKLGKQEKIYLFYKASEQTVIISNSLKKGAVWNEPCLKINTFSSFMESIQIFESKVKSDSPMIEKPSVIDDLWKPIEKKNTVKPLNW